MRVMPPVAKRRWRTSPVRSTRAIAATGPARRRRSPWPLTPSTSTRRPCRSATSWRACWNWWKRSSRPPAAAEPTDRQPALRHRVCDPLFVVGVAAVDVRRPLTLRVLTRLVLIHAVALRLIGLAGALPLEVLIPLTTGAFTIRVALRLSNGAGIVLTSGVVAHVLASFVTPRRSARQKQFEQGVFHSGGPHRGLDDRAARAH